MAKLLRKFTKTRTILLFSFILYFSSILIVFLDKYFTYRWIALLFHIASISIILLTYTKLRINKMVFKKIGENEIYILGAAMLVTVIVSFLFLKNYPFVSVMDEVRDGGLDAMRIYNGTIKNIFGYGNYNGYGQIIPTFASFFYLIFGSSVLTYRVPAAIIACIDVAFLYLLLHISINKSTALIGALVYALFPLHMFYARTELIVIFDSFWTSAMLLALCLWEKKRRPMEYVLLGTVLGVSANFHTSARVVSILILIMVIFIEAIDILRKKTKENLRKSIKNTVILGAFCLIGFGPMLLYSNTKTFFQSNRSIYSKDLYVINYIQSSSKFGTVKSNYKKSLLVWIYEGTTSRYPLHKPILPPFLSLLFAIGIGYAFFGLKKQYFNILISLVFLLPFFNSALTDWINADHRLVPMLTIGAVFTGIGATWITDRIHFKLGKASVLGLIFLYLTIQTNQFFTLLPSNYDKDVKAYLSMHIIYFLKSQNFPTNSAQNICLVVSPENFKNLNYAHYKEQYQYFVPNLTVSTKEESTMGDSEAYILKGQCAPDYKTASKLKTITCTGRKNFYCPVNYIGNITIHY